MLIFSEDAAQPQRFTVVFRCKTISEDTMAGNLTCALADKIKIRFSKKCVLILFSVFIVILLEQIVL